MRFSKYIKFFLLFLLLGNASSDELFATEKKNFHKKARKVSSVRKKHQKKTINYFHNDKVFKKNQVHEVCCNRVHMLCVDDSKNSKIEKLTKDHTSPHQMIFFQVDRLTHLLEDSDQAFFEDKADSLEEKKLLESLLLFGNDEHCPDLNLLTNENLSEKFGLKIETSYLSPVDEDCFPECEKCFNKHPIDWQKCPGCESCCDKIHIEDLNEILESNFFSYAKNEEDNSSTNKFFKSFAENRCLLSQKKCPACDEELNFHEYKNIDERFKVIYIHDNLKYGGCIFHTTCAEFFYKTFSQNLTEQEKKSSSFESFDGESKNEYFYRIKILEEQMKKSLFLCDCATLKK